VSDRDKLVQAKVTAYVQKEIGTLNKYERDMSTEKEFVNKLIERFRIEHDKQDRCGIYALTQKIMAYNSNKIEGSTLTSEQTASLFDTGTIVGEQGEVYRAKDVEEMTGHFKMFNYMLSKVGEQLSEDIIKQMHFHLKSGVFEDFANGYPVGEYKNRANIAGNHKTVSPSEVSTELRKLIASSKIKTVEDITVFHERFEHIHPFQDGNGRTGRMIIMKQCLDAGICPIIIRNDDRAIYINALQKAHDGDYSLLTKYFIEKQKEYWNEAYTFLESNI
jgi:Fic family protein